MINRLGLPAWDILFGMLKKHMQNLYYEANKFMTDYKTNSLNS